MSRRVEPWEIPASERATVGRVLEGLADSYQQRAWGDEGSPLSLIDWNTADELRAYAREILSWSEVNGSPNPNDHRPNRASPGRQRPS